MAEKEKNFDKFQKMLTTMRARLVGDVHHMADLALNRNDTGSSSMPVHPADVGSDNYDRDFTLQLAQNSRATLQQIDNALKRIEEGTYDRCEVCGGRIPKRRLEVVPYATMCVKCAEKAGL